MVSVSLGLGFNVWVPLLRFYGTLDYGLGLGLSGVGVQRWGEKLVWFSLGLGFNVRVPLLEFHGTLDYGVGLG